MDKFFLFLGFAITEAVAILYLWPQKGGKR